MSDPSAPAAQASNPPAAADTLTCKACSRTLATISAEGNLQPHGELNEGCALCKDMVMYCNEYEEVKGYFKELEHRRDDYRPRQLALEVVHEAQMNLGNFIQSVAAWESSSSSDEAPAVLSGEQPGEQTATPSADAADAQPRRKRSLSPQSSPPRKRAKRLRFSERGRRVSFDPSVVFRDAEAQETRVDAEFSRNSEGYSPGRYAAPEGSEWLDTSGSSLRETQFLGVQKRGRKWVPTKEGREMDEEWEMAGKEGGEEEEESEGNAASEDVSESQDEQMEGVIEKSEARPSSDIALPHRTAVMASDSSNQPSEMDLQPSSEGAVNTQVDEHPSPSDEAAPNEMSPSNEAQSLNNEDLSKD
ncbi:hypothetical protein P171DRAFT_489090 [Karstenula rhodostoma CBS 690.94]|uniref:Uncharacterized protein n=1 Tax=Karstenula rhodostoma CBS 690.94 TaxID=1392251 RepID=A0A9P4PBX9_9PLEO|nr:hypothetical protein P171DRAFT_489090 [Karstenula rhodostoma CBS 690.94]